MHSFTLLTTGLFSGHKSSFQMNLFCSCSASHPQKVIQCQIPHCRWNSPPPPLRFLMARSEEKRHLSSVPPDPNLYQSTLGDIAVSQYPTGSSLALPSYAVMFKASTAALRPGRGSKAGPKQAVGWWRENLYENKLEQEARQLQTKSSMGCLPSLHSRPLSPW